MDYKDLTAEQKERARACKTMEDFVALAQEEGVDLSDDQLEAVSGGGWNSCGKYKSDEECSSLCKEFVIAP